MGDFSFSVFMLLQPIVKKALTNWDELLPVRDTRVKVFCLLSGATCYVPSTSAETEAPRVTSYCSVNPVVLAGRRLPSIVCGRAGLPIHVLYWGFCCLKGMEKAVATWGKGLEGKEMHKLLWLFSDTAAEWSLQHYLSSQVWIQCQSKLINTALEPTARAEDKLLTW